MKLYRQKRLKIDKIPFSAGGRRGFTLIELIVAVFLIIVGTLGSFTLIQRIVSFTSISSSNLVAAYLAQEGIEVVRNTRDTNYLKGDAWDDGLDACSTGCEVDYESFNLSPDLGRFLNIGGDFGDYFYTYNAGFTTIYKRKITIVPQVDVLDVLVEVYWQERGNSHQVTAQTKLYNWR